MSLPGLRPTLLFLDSSAKYIASQRETKSRWESIVAASNSLWHLIVLSFNLPGPLSVPACRCRSLWGPLCVTGKRNLSPRSGFIGGCTVPSRAQQMSHSLSMSGGGREKGERRSPLTRIHLQARQAPLVCLANLCGIWLLSLSLSLSLSLPACDTTVYSLFLPAPRLR